MLYSSFEPAFCYLAEHTVALVIANYGMRLSLSSVITIVNGDYYCQQPLASASNGRARLRSPDARATMPVV